MPGRATRRRPLQALVLVLVLAPALAVGCGGGESTFTDEESGTFQVQMTRASFPERQHVSAAEDLVLAVRNVGGETIPQLAVTIWTGAEGVGGPKAQGAFASPTGPIWLTATGYPKVLEGGQTDEELDAARTAGAEAAPTDTYVFGELGPGQSRTLVWRVIPVRKGDQTVHYAVSAGSQGGAKAVTPNGSPAGGEFRVRIQSSPRGSCVVRSSDPGDCA